MTEYWTPTTLEGATPETILAANKFYMRKLSALVLAIKYLGGHEKRVQKFVGHERASFIKFVVHQIRSAVIPAQVLGCKILLDWRCPGWQKEEPELFGILVERDSIEVRDWRTSVLKRDGYACRACRDSESLHAHHILSWADNPGGRIELSNGVTLCGSCHRKHHSGPGVPSWR